MTVVNVKHVVDKVVKADKKGGRTVELLLPFEHMNKQITQVVFSPLLFDHILRWRAGGYKSFIEFMVEMSDLDLETFRMLRFQDADLCIKTFMGMLPDEIVNDVQAGTIPQRMEMSEIIDRFAVRPDAVGGPPAEEEQGGFDLEPQQAAE